MTTPYKLNNIRQLLIEGYSDEELRHYCFDQPQFKAAYQQLAEGTGKTKIVQLMLEQAEQHELFESLLAWAKAKNNVKYNRYQPYHYTSEDIAQLVDKSVELLGQHFSETTHHQEAATQIIVQNIVELVLAEVEKTHPFITQGYQKSPNGYQQPLSDALTQLLALNGAMTARVESLLAHYEAEINQQPASPTKTITIQQGNQGQAIIDSTIKGDVLGPGATKQG